MRFTVLALFIFGLFCLPGIYKRATHGVRLSKCRLELPYNPKWEIPPLSEEKQREIQSILNQPFSYLAKGKQSYVFSSEDGKYVLKLFRFDRCRLPFGQKMAKWVETQLTGRVRQRTPREKRILMTFNSCFLAYTIAQKQTGAVFVHLNPKSGFPLSIKDRMGRKFLVDPAHFRFVIQKRAKSLIQTLEDVPLASPSFVEIIDSFADLQRELHSLGLWNYDAKLGENFGILEGKVIQMDIGDLVYSPDSPPDQLQHYKKRLEAWIVKSKGKGE